jgi:hypothetical protein
LQVLIERDYLAERMAELRLLTIEPVRHKEFELRWSLNIQAKLIDWSVSNYPPLKHQLVRYKMIETLSDKAREYCLCHSAGSEKAISLRNSLHSTQ